MSDEKPSNVSELSALVEEMILSSKPLKVEQVGDGRWIFSLAGTRLPSEDELTKAVVRAKELEKEVKRMSESTDSSVYVVNRPRRLMVETKLTANTAETLELLKAALNNLVPENTLEVELTIKTVVRGEDNE